MKVILGDLNAKVGREECYQRTIGGESLHQQCNDNGTRLVQFAAARNIVVRSTYFPRSNIYKGTWQIPGRTITNQIDHVLIEARHFSSIINIRSHRGTTHQSDHYLVKCVMRVKITNRPKVSASRRIKFDIDKLKNVNIVAEYQTALNRKLNSVQNWNEKDVNDKEISLRTAISEVADEMLGPAPRQTKNNWFDNDCEKAVEEKRKAFLKYLQRKTRLSKRDYQNKRNESTRIITAKKKQNLQNEICKIEVMRTNNEVRNFYKAVKNQRLKQQNKPMQVKDDDGNLLSSPDDVLKQYKQYFSNLLNLPSAENPDLGPNIVMNDIIVDAPTYLDIEQAINHLKNCKSPGEDGLVAELLKSGGPELWKRVHDLILQIWQTETIPENWKTGLICPIFKKGDRLICNNYRGITLLDTTYKVLSSVIYAKLLPHAEQLVGDYQCGFRPSRSTIDQLFTIRQLLEKSWEFNVNIHQLFVDFKQAYDSVNRIALYEILKQLGIPTKLVAMIRATLYRSNGRVVLQNSLSEVFEISSGLKQGDGLSGLLFNLVLEWVIRRIDINWKGTLMNTSRQILGFADDLDLLGRGVIAVKEVFVQLERAAAIVGLSINEDKTKYMAIERKLRSRLGQNLTIDDYNIEVVQSFKYLGSTLNAQNDLQEELNLRLHQANCCYFGLRKLLKSNFLSRATKIRLYKTLIRPIITYGCEAWTLTVQQENILNIYERKILRYIFGPVLEADGLWRIRLNVELYDLYKDCSIVAFIKSVRIRWVGHVQRMNDSRTAKKVLLGSIGGDRAQGRPRKRWIDCVESDLRQLNIVNWRKVAEDRAKWKAVVESAKNLRVS